VVEDELCGGGVVDDDILDKHQVVLV